MKYVITGSLGHISGPIVSALVNSGHEVTVISSQQEKSEAIKGMGARAAIGSVTDVEFLRDTFKNAGAVYLMIPPNYSVDDFPAYQRNVADNYVEALGDSNVQHIVVLSSIGAHLGEGAGPIDALAYLEGRLKTLKDKHIQVLRPSFFYYNLLGMAGLLKSAGIIGSNFGDDKEKVALVHHLDIADRAIHYLTHPVRENYSIAYVVSDERYVAEIAAVLGRAVGNEQATWVCFPDEQAYGAMIQQGVNSSLANEYVEMGKGLREGRIQEDYWSRRLVSTSERKLETFAAEFAAVYNAIPEPAGQG